MKHRGNNICPDERTSERARKHNAFADIVEWRRYNKIVLDGSTQVATGKVNSSDFFFSNWDYTGKLERLSGAHRP